MHGKRHFQFHLHETLPHRKWIRIHVFRISFVTWPVRSFQAAGGILCEDLAQINFVDQPLSRFQNEGGTCQVCSSRKVDEHGARAGRRCRQPGPGLWALQQGILYRGTSFKHASEVFDTFLPGIRSFGCPDRVRYMAHDGNVQVPGFRQRRSSHPRNQRLNLDEIHADFTRSSPPCVRCRIGDRSGTRESRRGAVQMGRQVSFGPNQPLSFDG